jgi:transposase-like protein
MPWKTTAILDQKTRFVLEHAEGELSVAELCRLYGISRKTGYKWIGRHAEAGLAGLQDQPRIAKEQPQAVPLEVEEWILAGRTLFPTWGPKKLVAWARRESGLEELCAISTAGEILRRHGLTVPRKITRKNEPFAGLLVEGKAPNELWCVDFKGHFKLGDRSRCEPLTMTDAATRYLLRCQALPNTGLAGARRIFEAAFREFGLPERIRSDNGAPFSSIGLGGLSVLSLWWIKLGITPERIAPGQPCQNGRHERMHRTLKAQTANPPAPTLRAQQRCLIDSAGSTMRCGRMSRWASARRRVRMSRLRGSTQGGRRPRAARKASRRARCRAMGCFTGAASGCSWAKPSRVSTWLFRRKATGCGASALRMSSWPLLMSAKG